ncbi:MAG: acyl carrier protein [Candidatus Hodarchaeales archaeon]|jgi:acyl carrier protein
MNNAINDILSKILLLEKEEINDKISRTELEQWDSMTHLILISEIEQEFNLILSDDDVTGIQTIGDIYTLLIKHGINQS